MRWLEDRLNDMLLILLNISLIVLTVCTFLQVVSRFVFQLPIPWSTDIIRISFIYVIFLAVPVLIKLKDHITIDILLSVLPPKLLKLFEIIITIFILLFSIILCYSGYKFMMSSGNQFMPYLRVSMFYVYAVIPFSSLISIFFAGMLLTRELKQLVTNSD